MENKTYFCLSDIHGFFPQMKEALWRAGFRKTNKNHILIINGDLFDRGSFPLQVYNFIHLIPKNRRILIKGNHESLYMELLKKPFPERHDWHNMTVETFCDIAGMPVNLLNEDTYDYNYDAYYEGSRKAWKEIVERVEKSEVTKWLRSKEWKNYYELGNYIFTHSFIPTKPKEEIVKQIGSYAYSATNIDYLEYDPDWRKYSDQAWETFMWGNPWQQYQADLFKPEEDNGKVLVVGHWHTSDFYRYLKLCHIFDNECAPIYYSKGLIGLDGGVMRDWFYGELIHPQNILVIKDPNSYECFDQNGAKLIEMEGKLERIIKTVTLDKDDNELPSSDDFLGEE